MKFNRLLITVTSLVLSIPAYAAKFWGIYPQGQCDKNAPLVSITDPNDQQTSIFSASSCQLSTIY